MITIQLSEEHPIALDPSLLEQAALAALQVANAPADADLTVVLTGDTLLHQLNQQFLGIDAPTDVLSFPAGEVDPDTEQPYLGDVIISVERTQAQSGAHPVQDELRLLVVHGVLHLLGYDHAEKAEKDAMWQTQRQVLRSLGCESIAPE